MSFESDVQATFCATLVDEWVHCGVRHAVVAPGSRSTPMAVALAADARIAVHVVHDERVAAFVALGLGLDGDPSLLLCTSGTAAANFFPAVVEAGLSEIPMIVLTADRPPELRGIGAPQTIDQIDLYGRHVRWSHDPGVPDVGTSGTWRALAVDAWRHTVDGPVQLNLAFREPLLGTPGELPPTQARPSADVAVRPRDPVPDAIVTVHGVILAGGRSGVDPGSIAALAAATGWPIVADPISQVRHLDDVVVNADAMTRVAAFADSHRPDVVVRIGRPAASKVLAQWLAATGAPVVQVGGPGVIDPDHTVAAVCGIEELLATAAQWAVVPDPAWRASWLAADRRADAAIVAALAGLSPEVTEPGVARTIADQLPDDVRLVVASSMPVRDLEWFGGRRARAHANRGANGVDGTISTARGLALSGGATVVWCGDLAFVHDVNALVGLAGSGTDLRVVVTDNDGGGIFSFLPQAAALDHARFEQLFGTPLGVDVEMLATSMGVPAHTVASLDELAAQLVEPGPWMCRVRTDRARNVEVHDRLHAAVAAAITSAR